MPEYRSISRGPHGNNSNDISFDGGISYLKQLAQTIDIQINVATLDDKTRNCKKGKYWLRICNWGKLTDKPGEGVTQPKDNDVSITCMYNSDVVTGIHCAVLDFDEDAEDDIDQWNAHNAQTFRKEVLTNMAKTANLDEKHTKSKEKKQKKQQEKKEKKEKKERAFRAKQGKG